MVPGPLYHKAPFSTLPYHQGYHRWGTPTTLLLNPARNTKLDKSLRKDIEESDSSFGDLNKTARTYPVKNRDYLSILDEYNLVELMTKNTRIPKTVRGADTPTTDPDSLMSYCRFNESVRFISRETLRLDHLAYVMESVISNGFQKHRKSQHMGIILLIQV